MVLGNLDSIENDDKVLVLGVGASLEYGIYEELVKNPDAEIMNYYRTK